MKKRGEGGIRAKGEGKGEGKEGRGDRKVRRERGRERRANQPSQRVI